MVPDSLENESQILKILLEHFGGMAHILGQFKRLHHQLGIIPSARDYKGNLQLQKRADLAAGHYALIKRAETI